ncbi:MAG: segregation/condensation protein A [Planctomycetota bacterium]|jgi:segregation and condensation protein A|nr:segregation/condensation protein A [Planctomycetota bacterium]
MSLDVAIPDTFSGPLDLLLDLIRREEMDINDINVARLASAYLGELRKMALVDVDEAGEFLSLASRLLEIKSRLILPPEEETAEGEDDGDENFDPRADLVAVLLEYRRFRDAAKHLGDMAEERSRRFPRFPPLPDAPPPAATQSDGLELMRAFRSILERAQSRMAGRIFAPVHREVPIASRIQQIGIVLAEAGRTRFSLLLSDDPDRMEIVGFFVAMLEMIRQGILIARQVDNFTDIVLEPHELSQEKGKPAFRRPARIRLFAPSGFSGAAGRKKSGPLRRIPCLAAPVPSRMGKRPARAIVQPPSAILAFSVPRKRVAGKKWT